MSPRGRRCPIEERVGLSHGGGRGGSRTPLDPNPTGVFGLTLTLWGSLGRILWGSLGWTLTLWGSLGDPKSYGVVCEMDPMGLPGMDPDPIGVSGRTPTLQGLLGWT